MSTEAQILAKSAIRHTRYERRLICKTNPISEESKMIITLVITMTNNNRQRTMNYSKQTQSNPIQSQFQGIMNQNKPNPVVSLSNLFRRALLKWAIASELACTELACPEWPVVSMPVLSNVERVEPNRRSRSVEPINQDCLNTKQSFRFPTDKFPLYHISEFGLRSCNDTKTMI
jgi:hypothetical protein